MSTSANSFTSFFILKVVSGTFIADPGDSFINLAVFSRPAVVWSEENAKSIFLFALQQLILLNHNYKIMKRNPSHIGNKWKKLISESGIGVIIITSGTRRLFSWCKMSGVQVMLRSICLYRAIYARLCGIQANIQTALKLENIFISFELWYLNTIVLLFVNYWWWFISTSERIFCWSMAYIQESMEIV